MSPSEKITKPVIAVSAEDVQRRSAIDRTTRLPVLFFYTSAGLWLVIATLLGLLSSIKIYAPNFLGWEWTNFGYTQPAFINALVYGWAMQAGFGTMIWIMARLCRTELKNPITLVVAGHFWNLGVAIGIIGILSGQGAPGKLLEFPSAVWPILLFSFLLITVWMVIMFVARRNGEVYISQWYLLAACFTFPWAYSTAHLVINTLGKSGIIGASTASWYAGNLIFMWLVPVGLASAYYIIPKVVGRQIYSYQLAKIAFWSLMALGGWTGIQDLIGGPLPAWMPAIAGGAQILMLLPVIAVGINHLKTAGDKLSLINHSPSLRFTFFGSIGYCISCVILACVHSVTLGRYTQFSFAADAATFSAVYAFFSMMMIGAIYFIVPRVTNCEWLSGGRIRFHFWMNAYGAGAVVFSLLVGGIFYGTAADAWDRDFESAVSLGNSFKIGATLGWILLLLGNVSFFFHLAALVMNKGKTAGRPTLIHGEKFDHAEVVITTEGAEPA
jgi:cytochrome c oxidase cbb3-type subunit 1